MNQVASFPGKYIQGSGAILQLEGSDITPEKVYDVLSKADAFGRKMLKVK